MVSPTKYYYIKDFPADMQALIFEFVEAYGEEFINTLESISFQEKQIELSVFPCVEMETDHRTIEYAMSIDLEKAPPILIANDGWLDGRHRVFKAYKTGQRTIKAIDLSKVMPRFSTQDGDGLGELSICEIENNP